MNNNNNNKKNSHDTGNIGIGDSSIDLFVSELNLLLEKETFDYCFYDFPRVEIREKNSLYEILEKIKFRDNYKGNIMKYFCDEVNKHLLFNYKITNVSNIICSKTYKYKNRIDIPIQLNNGYCYSFTAICSKKYS